MNGFKRNIDRHGVFFLVQFHATNLWAFSHSLTHTHTHTLSLSLSLSLSLTLFCLQESSSLGLPVVRPLFLHYWEDPRSLAISYQQFLVGSEILVAPVLDKGHGHVWTYFPSSPDEWTHVWTGTIYSHRPSLVKIRAPLGYPAIFVKSKSPVGHTFLQNLRDLHLICPNEEI